MLKDSIDFDYNLKQIKQEIDSDIQLQDEVMDSEKMNNTFSTIESNLNSLYEKTRYLEDAIEYAKTFTEVKINEYTAEINSMIKSISDISNISRNMGYVQYEVPFTENVVDIPDRNKNYKIKPCKVRESTTSNNDKYDIITLNNYIDQTCKINSVSFKCDQIPYDSVLMDANGNKNKIAYTSLNNSALSENKPSSFYGNLSGYDGSDKYMTLYLEQKPVENDLVQTMTVSLAEPCEVNELEIVPVNCYIENIRYVYVNGIEEYAGDLMTGIEPESRIITHIKFDMRCNKYSTITYELDKEALSMNAWDFVKSIEYPDVVADTKLNTDIILSRTEINPSGNKVVQTYKTGKQAEKVNMYVYNFGLDILKVNRVELYEDGYFLSEPINIGSFKSNEYIQLVVDDCIETGCGVEYYIVDGDVDKSIVPVGTKIITDEMIFPDTDLRFTIDEDLHSDGLKQIKKDGLNINISLEDAKTSYDGRYSADYQPLDTYYNYTPLNNTIRIKAIIRTYGDQVDTIPYIKSILINKYGGNTLWTNLY